MATETTIWCCEVPDRCRVFRLMKSSKFEEMGEMKNKKSKLIYGLLVPAMVALLAIACNASAVWGS